MKCLRCGAGPEWIEESTNALVPENDFTVRCRCGWIGKKSQLKSLKDFAWGCPTCGAEFVDIIRHSASDNREGVK